MLIIIGLLRHPQELLPAIATARVAGEGEGPNGEGTDNHQHAIERGPPAFIERHKPARGVPAAILTGSVLSGG